MIFKEVLDPIVQGSAKSLPVEVGWLKPLK
jgi:hypothetical protein